MKEFIVPITDPVTVKWYVDEQKIPELIRCKDCGKRGTSDCTIENLNGDACFPWVPPDDWFCADGSGEKA